MFQIILICIYEKPGQWRVAVQYDDLEFINIRNVLNCIERSINNLSRAKIAKEVGLSMTSVSIIVQRLINLGLVLEHEAETSGVRGRPGTPLSLNPDVWGTLSVHVTTMVNGTSLR